MGSIGDILLREKDSLNMVSSAETFNLEYCEEKESHPWDEKTRTYQKII